ncbi:MAG: response regulator transcription factor [Patescibacteria group bacterium]|nr:response regulator transcription factor [Patescibacteria group bacterium]
MRILVVEDEPRIARSLKKGLELERYVVDLATTGPDGFDLASSESYDVIILDRMLPGMDGLTVCQNLRSSGNQTPILMLTAKSQLSDRVEGLDGGADDYLGKPFSFEELLARLRALCRRPPRIEPPILKIRDLELHPKSSAVYRNGHKIPLTAREYDLLEYLMRNAGFVITKQKLIDTVWEFDADVLPNTVEVFIGKLRSKLSSPEPELPPVIRTVRGFGYTIDP